MINTFYKCLTCFEKYKKDLELFQTLDFTICTDSESFSDSELPNLGLVAAGEMVHDQVPQRPRFKSRYIDVIKMDFYTMKKEHRRK